MIDDPAEEIIRRAMRDLVSRIMKCRFHYSSKSTGRNTESSQYVFPQILRVHLPAEIPPHDAVKCSSSSLNKRGSWMELALVHRQVRQWWPSRAVVIRHGTVPRESGHA